MLTISSQLYLDSAVNRAKKEKKLANFQKFFYGQFLCFTTFPIFFLLFIFFYNKFCTEGKLRNKVPS